MGEPNWDALPPEFKGPVQKLRHAAGEGSVTVLANGKGVRNWSVERKLLVAGAIWGCLTSVAVAIFMFGGEYRTRVDAVNALTDSVSGLTSAVDIVAPQLLELRVEQRGIVRQIQILEAFHGMSPRSVQSPASADRATPRFPRDEQFAPDEVVP